MTIPALIVKYVIYALGTGISGIFLFKDKKKGLLFAFISTILLILIDFLFAKFA